ncbi:MAG TPA: hypothetical protein VKR55_07095 [Bradyrhizobium sp.]|uniref:hypothetical protein n=1 Tax=Bradyrhizobium sp. TaxID=376 RepID=UPI002BE851CB|nr:hypothetical protein [Bradyrhizobium sp.]HLZ01904.1 hypothetical protein [Bradyrhizobium sp.]
MRAYTVVPVMLAMTLGMGLAGPALAGARIIQVDANSDTPRPTTAADFQKYRGYMYDLSDYAGRKDIDKIEENLKHQLDMVENAGLSPMVLSFFHSIPIVATETDCLEETATIACYGPVARKLSRPSTHGVTLWDHDKQQWTNPDIIDLAADSGIGVIMLRPTMTQYTDDPILLHEFLHAYHARLMPNGYNNRGIKGYYAYAKSKDLLDKKSYTMKNDREFFAVTASIFLAGKESIHEPKTREALKEKLPDYYKYLVGVFGFDPDPSKTPVAANTASDAPAADAVAN